MPFIVSKKAPSRKKLKRLVVAHRIKALKGNQGRSVVKRTSRRSNSVNTPTAGGEHAETFTVAITHHDGYSAIDSISSNVIEEAAGQECRDPELRGALVCSAGGLGDSKDCEVANCTCDLSREELLQLYSQNCSRPLLVMDIAKMANRYKLSNECLKSVFQLMRKHAAGSVEAIPKTFGNYIVQLGIYNKFELQFYWKCSKCPFFNGIQNPQNWNTATIRPKQKKSECQNHHPWERNMTHYIKVGLRGLLQQILPRIFNHIFLDKMRSAALDKLKEKVGFRQGDIVLNLCTDGIPISKSSAGAAWPVLATIYGTSRKLQRGLGMLILAFYRSTSHISNDDMKEVLRAVLDDILETAHKPILWRQTNGAIMTTRVYVLNMCADTPARSQVMDMMAFNSKQGCTYCLHEQPGPYFSHKRSEKRTHEHYMQCVESIVSDPVCGVKGVSVLTKLPYFDVIEGCPIDPMHNVYLGVFKFLLNVWMDSKNHKKPFYIEPYKQSCLGNKFRAIKPPSRISRPPRHLSERAHFKASEFHFWGLYAAPVLLSSYLHKDYYWNYMQLAVAISLMSKPKISEKDLEDARYKLRCFFHEFYDLYADTKHHRYNIHLLQHLPDFVKLYGSLPNFSMTMFESKMFVVKGFVTGSQYPSAQIMKKYLMEVVCNSDDPLDPVTPNAINLCDPWEFANPVKDRFNPRAWQPIHDPKYELYNEIITAGGVKVRSSLNAKSKRKSDHIFWIGESKVIEIHAFVLDTSTGERLMAGKVYDVGQFRGLFGLDWIQETWRNRWTLLPMIGPIHQGYKIEYFSGDANWTCFGRFLNNVELNSD